MDMQVIPGTEFRCLIGDTASTPHCLEQRTLAWEQCWRDLPELDLVTPGSAVIDVGAFIGHVSILFKRRGARVFAFEPNPLAFECLRHNLCTAKDGLGHPSDPDAYVFNRAVGSGNERVALHQVQHGNMGNTRVVPALDGQPSVECIPLDNVIPVIASTLSFVKIDAEGSECSVLEGAREILHKFRPVLAVEFNPAMLKRQSRTVEDLERLLTELGYPGGKRRQFFRYYDQNWDLVCHPEG